MSENELTLVMGASLKPYRYSYRAIQSLKNNGYGVEAIGLREGEVHGVQIQTGLPALQEIHTVTLYLGEENQKPVEEYILSLKPQRVIFNPGAENPGLEKKLRSANVEALRACTLVMLATGVY
jgi:predicted CoA-binding protein